MKVFTVCLVIGIAFSNGAVIKSADDELLQMVQSFLVQPDEVAAALGFQRVKRDAGFDREFSLDRLGLHAGLKYVDASNRWKGGRLEINIDDLQRLVPKAKSHKVNLVITLDGGDAPRDGLFTLTVDYELNHANKETGTAKIVRTKSGGNWNTVISVVSTNNPAVKIIPVFEITLQSDRMTKLQGTYKCEHGNDYTVNVDRVPGEKIDAVIEGNGRTYTIAGRLNKADKSVKVDIDANGLDYSIEIEHDEDDNQHKLEAKINLGPSGSYNVELFAEKEYGGAGLKVEFNGRAILSAKLKGKLDKSNHAFKYEVRYIAVGIGEGKLRIGVVSQPNQELKLQWLPKTGDDLKLELTRDAHDDGSRHWKALATKGGEMLSQYKLDIEPENNANNYDLSVESDLQLSENSKFYSLFCTMACFKQRNLKAKMSLDKANPGKVAIKVDVTKDSDNVFDLDVNTVQSPYVMRLKAPRLLPLITTDGRDLVEVTADHNPGQYLKLRSNSPLVKSLDVAKTNNGEERVVTLNGKEVFRGEFKKTGNSFTQRVELADGRHLTTTISWESDNPKNNKVTVVLEGSERKFNGYVKWDVSNHDAMSIQADGTGQNRIFGDYHIERNLKINCDHGKHTAIALTGTASFSNAPFPSRVDTDIASDINYETGEFSGRVKKTVDGRVYGMEYKDGRLNILS